VAKHDKEAITLGTGTRPRALSKGILDLWFLVGSALIVCVLGVGAFSIAEIRHINPLWIFLSLISIGFFAGAFEEYRSEFRSARFVFFVCGWILINITVVVMVGSYGLLSLIPALLLEQFLFYMTAYWLFGVQPSLGRRKDPPS
jgi:hypothetical protein